MEGCPYCEREDCKHRLVSSSVYNCDFDGPLVAATQAVVDQLRAALLAWLSLESDSQPSGSSALDALVERLQDAWDGDEASVDGSGAWAPYWIELSEDASNTTVVRNEFDEGGPGTGEVYRDVYGDPPDDALKSIVSLAEDDLAAVKRELPVEKPKRKAAKKKSPAKQTRSRS